MASVRLLPAIAGEWRLAPPEVAQVAAAYANEHFIDRFRHVVSLPEDLEPAMFDPSYPDGILRVTLAKRESSKPKQIEIN